MKAPRYFYPGEKPYRMIYMADSFGNIVEIHSQSLELTYSASAYLEAGNDCRDRCLSQRSKSITKSPPLPTNK